MTKKISVIFENTNPKTYDACINAITCLTGYETNIYIIDGINTVNSADSIHYLQSDQNVIRTVNAILMQILNDKTDVLLIDSRSILTRNSIDEMLSVLRKTEKHGIVCAHHYYSNDVNKPYQDLNDSDNKGYASAHYQKMPRFVILPVTVDFPVLIKYEVLLIGGFFDETYGSLAAAIDEYSLRVNQFGFSTVKANYATSYFFKSSDILNLKEKELNEKLMEQYPYICEYLPLYLDYNCTGSGHFLENPETGTGRIKLLFSLYELGKKYNGTAQHALFLLDAFYQLYSDKYDISILINKAADKFFGVSDKYKNVLYPENITGCFDIAYIPGQFFNIRHLFLINKFSIKYVFDMQDIISMRCDYIMGSNAKYIKKILFRTALEYCDGFTTLSNFVNEDTRNYFSDIFQRREIPSKTIYLTNTVSCDLDSGNRLTPFSEYILVFGNEFKHKNINNLIKEIKNSKYNYVIIGTASTGFIDGHVYGLKSGKISNEDLDSIMRHSLAFLFPSIYEGFGLPIFNALAYKKIVIVYDSSLNRELKKYLDKDGRYVVTYKKTAEIEECLDNIISGNTEFDIKFERDWTDVAKEVEAFIGKIVNKPIDAEFLDLRWRNIKIQEFLYTCTGTPDNSAKIKKNKTENVMKHPQMGRFSMAKRKLKDSLKKNHPGLVKFLKKFILSKT